MRIRHNSGDHGGSDDVVLEIMEIQAFTIFINRFHSVYIALNVASVVWFDIVLLFIDINLAWFLMHREFQERISNSWIGLVKNIMSLGMSL